MTLMENLNKDPGPVKYGCGYRLFIWRRPPLPPSQVAHGKSRDRQQLLCALSEGCVLFHINDKGGSGSKKSLSYTHLFKNSQAYNTVGRGPQESSESWGTASMTKGRNNLTFFFVPWNKGRPISGCCWCSPKPGTSSCISMGLFLHKERSTAAWHSHLTPVVKPFSLAQTIEVVPPLG